MSDMITQEELKRFLRYDPETGNFYWRAKRRHIPAGSVAGSVYANDRRMIKFNQHRYLSYRLAWFYMTGSFPPDGIEIDHIDGDPSNDRWSNLRLATRRQNACNQQKRSDNTSGFKGVSFIQSKRGWQASIMIDGKNKNLGIFKSPEEAHEAYCRASSEYHGEFSNHG